MTRPVGIDVAGGRYHVAISIVLLSLAQPAGAARRVAVYDPDPVSATKVITDILDAAGPGDEIYVPAGPTGAAWRVGPLVVGTNRVAGQHGCDDITLTLGGSTVLASAVELFTNGQSCLFSLQNSRGVALQGEAPGATLQVEAIAGGEWRHAVKLAGCSAVSVRGLRVTSRSGDGIYVGTGRQAFCTNVVIEDCAIESCYRNGISVISARDLLIRRCRLADTHGTPPQAGIDFEPNSRNHFLSDIRVEDCLLENNSAFEMLFYLWYLASNTAPLSVTFRNVTVNPGDTPRALWLGGDDWPSDGSVNGDPAGQLRFEDVQWLGAPNFRYPPPGFLTNLSVVHVEVLAPDRLPDAWETQHFGHTSLTETGDADGDGQSNWAEYVAGTSPTDPASRLTVAAEAVDGQVRVSYQSVPASGPGYTNVARYYTLKYKEELTDTVWHDVEGETRVAGDGAARKYWVPEAIARQILRLSVQLE